MGSGTFKQGFQVQGQVFQPHLPRLDLREIKHFVHNRHQEVARILQFLQQGSSLGLVHMGFQQLGHAQNTVQRRANFMIHLSKELRPLAAHTFGLQPRILELDIQDRLALHDQRKTPIG